MNSSVIRLLTMSAFAGLSFGALRAEASTATFDLPVEAHWGAVVLTPGHYTMSPSSSATGNTVFYVTGAQGGRIVAPSVVRQQESSGKSCLRLVRVQDAYYVQSYTSSSRGTSFEFHVPNARRELKLETRTIETSGY